MSGDRPPTNGDTSSAQDERIGLIAGIAAYGMWGLFPLFFHLLSDVNPLEIIGHRILWTAALMVVLMSLGSGWAWLRRLLSTPRRAVACGAAGVFLSANWLIYVWAIANDRVVDASLGYFINPLVTVMLGVLVLHEQLRPLQWAAVGAGMASVAVLVLAYGAVPWVSLGLAASFGTYGLLKKQVGLGPIEALAAETLAVVPAAAIGMVIAAATNSLAFTHVGWGTRGLLIAAGAVTAAPLLCFGVATNRIPLSLIGLLQYLTPVLQFLLGVLVFHEEVPPSRLVGFVLIWAALALLVADGVRSGRATRGRVVAAVPLETDADSVTVHDDDSPRRSGRR